MQSKERHREYVREKYRTDPTFREKMLARTRRNGLRYAQAVTDLLTEFRSRGCLLCPEKSQVCLSAHHVDPSQKDFSIGEAKQNKLSPGRVAAELKKCVCLCHNCHAKVHAGILSLPK